jgi:hypothetical protein
MHELRFPAPPCSLKRDVTSKTPRMHVIEERFEDAGERDANGHYDYYYSGIIYRFVFPTLTLVARRYDDTAGEVSFLTSENSPRKKAAMFTEVPYRSPEFRKAVAFLRTRERVESIQVLLCEGYVPIDLNEISDWVSDSALP